jgi:signal transduction histidine kinase
MMRYLSWTSLRLRLILGAGVWICVGLALGGVLLSSVFRGTVERAFDARLLADLEIVIAAADPQSDGSLDIARQAVDPRFEIAFSGWYWQVRDAAVLNPNQTAMMPIASLSLWDRRIEIPDTPTIDGLRATYAEGPENQRLRVIERDISLPDLAAAARGETAGPRYYRFAVAGDIAGIEREIAAFNATLAWSLAALGAGLLIAVLIQVQIVLQPVRRIKEGLAAIRSGRAQKLEGALPDEIVPLATELNALVSHNAEVVARARTHVGNLAHFLKTPLTVLSNEAQGQSGPLAEAVLKQTEAMRRQVDHYLARARAAATVDVLGARTDVAPVVADLARTLEKIHTRRGIDIDWTVPEGLAFRGERQDFEELAGNLMDNACKWARTLVEIRAERSGEGKFRLIVSDDGPGLKPEERARVLERGERLDESVPGTGLGLGIVRDIARLYGGGIDLDTAEELGGLKAILTLPAAGE